MPETYHKPHASSGTPSPAAPSGSEASSSAGLDPGRLMRVDAPIAEQLLRTAGCLTALMHSPTAQAGLNESRYQVLDILRRQSPATCSQTALAQKLLQSESNLSTLLDRMKDDGLISRARSEHDRRITLVALSEAGREVLAPADAARARAAATVFQIFDEQREATLSEALGRLQHKLEMTLGIANRAAARADSTGSGRRFDQHPSAAIVKRPDEPVRHRATLQNSDEPTS